MTVFAFFDVDDTLINDKSMFSFMKFWFDQKNNPIGFIRFMDEIKRQKADPDIPRSEINYWYYSTFEGYKVDEVDAVGQAWFEIMSKKENFLNTNVVNRLKEHQESGVEPVFVSGSFPVLMRPVAELLGVKHILSANLEIVGDRYTGKLIPPQTIGFGKGVAIKKFIEGKNSDLDDCFAYGDDISDLSMLKLVGNPWVVKFEDRLVAHAKKVGWPVLDPR